MYKCFVFFKYNFQKLVTIATTLVVFISSLYNRKDAIGS